MAPQLRLKQWIGDFVVIEAAGQYGGTALYVAARKGDEHRFWLLASDQPLEHLTEHLPQVEIVQARGARFAAFPVESASLGTVASLLRVFDLAFIGWRWAGVAESLQALHAAGRAYQKDNAFALDHFYLNDALQIMPLTSKSTQTMHFPAPEPPDALTPASDVYSLGAALLALLGERAPDETVLRTRPAQGQLSRNPQVWDVLQRATDADPSRRYADGHTFALALTQAAPRPQSIRVESITASARSRGGVFGWIDSVLLTLGPAVVFVVVVIVLFLIFRNQLGLSFDLPFGLLAGQRPEAGVPVAARRTAVPVTPTPLPPGPLSFDSVDLSLTSGCTAHLNLNIGKGGQPLPGDLPIDFEVRSNGQRLAHVIQAPGATEFYRYQLVFAAGRLCEGGALFVQATLADAVQSMTLCHSGEESTGALTSLDGLSFSGAQVNVDNYPDVTTYFNVVDANGAALGLRRTTRCEVAQDERPITDFSFTPSNDLADPLTVALVFDVSGSMSGTPLANARKAASAFIQQLAPSASVCVYTFSTAINKLQACTPNHAAATAAVGRIAAGGDTALYDALVRVVSDQRALSGRQAIIVLSDGADTASRTALKDALVQVQQAGIPVFAIGLVSRDFNGDILKQISTATGASYLEAPTSADLDKLYPLIQGQLRRQYSIRFTSAFPERKSGNVVVRLWDGAQHIELTHPFVVK